MKTEIIIDTDIGCDCDDAAALALALELMKEQECEVLAVTNCTKCEAGAGCVEAILRYYGYSGIPVGSFCKEDEFAIYQWCDVYATDVAMKYETQYSNGRHYENTVKVMRKALAGSAGDVKIVTIGAFTSLAHLLLSGPDEYSDLTGIELVREKVQSAICMAGGFSERGTDGCTAAAEWNVKCSIEAAKIVCEKWPSEIAFCGFEIGVKMITCGELQMTGPENNPVRTCFEIWHEKNGNGHAGRYSWDAATVLHAIRPDAGYWNLYSYGKITVDDDGHTLWQPDMDGKHTFLTEKMDPQKIEAQINEILNRDITGNDR